MFIGFNINIARHGPSLLVDVVRPCPCICLDVVRPSPSLRLDFAARPYALPSTRAGVSHTKITSAPHRKRRKSDYEAVVRKRRFSASWNSHGSTKTSGQTRWSAHGVHALELLSHLLTRTVLWSWVRVVKGSTQQTA